MRVSHTLIIMLVFLSLNVACCQRQTARKLNSKERLDFVERGIYPSETTLYKDSLGAIIEDANLIDYTMMGLDLYANDRDEIVECVVRRKTAEDRILRKQIIDAAQFRDLGPIEQLEIDCSRKLDLLEAVYKLDQENRKSNDKRDINIDRQNVSLVTSIIESCGFPRREEVGDIAISGLFLVIQHSPRKFIEKYLPEVKKCASMGDLSLAEVALMEDRLLMLNGERQIYGTQVVRDFKTGGWKVYPIQDVRNVNQRREEAGLEPIEKYLSQWDINFESK